MMSQVGFAQPKEDDYTEAIAKSMPGSTTQFILPDGTRPDILQQDIVWEVEWLDKYDAALSQSLRYAMKTGNEPGIIFLIRSKPEKTKRDMRDALIPISYVRGLGATIHVRFIDVRDIEIGEK